MAFSFEKLVSVSDIMAPFRNDNTVKMRRVSQSDLLKDAKVKSRAQCPNGRGVTHFIDPEGAEKLRLYVFEHSERKSETSQKVANPTRLSDIESSLVTQGFQLDGLVDSVNEQTELIKKLLNALGERV